MGGRSSKPLEGVERGTVIDTFKAKWVGSIPVNAMSGKDVARQALQRLLEMRMREVPCIIEVTTQGVYLLQATTKDALKEVAISDVSFVAQDTQQPSVVSFFENYQQLHVVMSHTVKLNASMAYNFSIAINKAFKELHENENTDANKDWSGAAQVGIPKRRRMSYKQALKAETKSEAQSSSPEADTSRVVAEQEDCMFIGSLEVEDKSTANTAKGAAAHGIAIVKENGTKGTPCTLIISEERVRAMASAAGSVKGRPKKCLFDLPIASISAAHQEKIRFKTDFTIVTHDTRLDIVTAYHVVTPPQNENEDSLRRVLHNQQVKSTEIRRDRRQTMVSRPYEVEDASDKEFSLIGNFEATYLGKCWVASVRVPVDTKESGSSGGLVPDKIAKGSFGEDAVKFVTGYKKEPRLSVVQVSDEGVRRIDAATFETRMFAHSGISATKVVFQKYLVVYLTKGKENTLALVFQCVGRRADDIALAIAQGFKASTTAKSDDPFKAVGGRTSAPSSLFAKQVHRGELKAQHELGAGAFGVVYKAVQTSPGGKKTTCAVKCLRQGASDADKEEFVREAEACLQFDHVNVCVCVGVAVQQRPWLIVLEFIEYGDVQSVLEQADRTKIQLQTAELLLLCHGIVKGMEHISSKRFIHMDLAARNVLLAPNNVTKITDFGLARKLPDGQDRWRSKQVLKLPVKWCAPESMTQSRFSIESDVWACGVTLWEVFSYGRVPYGSIPVRETLRRVKDGLRLQRPRNFPQGLWNEVKQCFNADWNARPTFKDLATHFATVVRNECASPRSNLRDVAHLVKTGEARS